MSKVIGVIGLGSIGSRHVKNIEELGHKVISYDPDPSKKPTQLVADMVIGDSDAVVIASPTSTHANYIARVMSANKWAFVEKPLANEGILFGEDAGKKLFVGYNLRFRSCVKSAKEWMSKIGTPVWANFTVGQFSDKPDYLRDGVVLNWSHEIDLALHLLGPAKVASSVTALDNGKDVMSDIILLHDGGGQSCVHLDYLTKPEIRQFVIVGNDATIIGDIIHNQAWLRGADETVWDHCEDIDSFTSDYLDEMKAFIDRIDGKDTIGCDGNEAREVLKICLCVKEQSGQLKKGTSLSQEKD